MKNAMQLKALIKNFALDKEIMPQAVLQNYMLERLIERMSRSQYKDKFILKGGMLIAALIGIDIRTRDLNSAYEGRIAEHIVGQELIAISNSIAMKYLKGHMIQNTRKNMDT